MTVDYEDHIFNQFFHKAWSNFGAPTFEDLNDRMNSCPCDRRITHSTASRSLRLMVSLFGQLPWTSGAMT